MEVIYYDVEDTQDIKSDVGFDEIREIVYSSNGKCEITVVIQAYGKLDKTRLCVETVLEHTRDLEYKLILVDNGTPTDEILDYYKSIKHDNLRILKISKNLTSCFAVSIFKNLIDTEYLAIVNNDIIVTSNWLSNLMSCIKSSYKIGMVCPVSTNISNLQEEDLGGFYSLENMQEKAAIFNQSDPNKWEEKLKLIPTVTVLRREIIDRVGTYDISFYHDFGDDDYSFRIRRAGYQLKLCRDTFVHHNHVRSIEEEEAVQKIFLKGRMDFQKKYFGLDAWEDALNGINAYLNGFPMLKDNDSIKRALFLEPRCGTPILDMKNFLKREEELQFDAFITDAKYHVDLQLIADRLNTGGIHTISEVYRDNMFDFAILCEDINNYENPFVLLDKIGRTVKTGGYIIIRLGNVYDYRTLFTTLGFTKMWNQQSSYALHYENLIAKINEMIGNQMEVICQPHVVNKAAKDLVNELLKNLLNGENKDVVEETLMTEKFWFCIRKK